MNKKEDPLWDVRYSTKAGKQRNKLSLKFQQAIDLLVLEIEKYGPIRKNWPHFGDLSKAPGIPDKAYHCHLNNGKPTYVSCWYVEDKKNKIVEIFYVGTHENAPY